MHVALNFEPQGMRLMSATEKNRGVGDITRTTSEVSHELHFKLQCTIHSTMISSATPLRHDKIVLQPMAHVHTKRVERCTAARAGNFVVPPDPLSSRPGPAILLRFFRTGSARPGPFPTHNYAPRAKFKASQAPSTHVTSMVCSDDLTTNHQVYHPTCSLHYL
jgi:hypothetical protein